MAISAMIVIIGFSSVVRADMGAKPHSVITVINAPDEEYYIALLAKDGPYSSGFTPDNTLSDKENETIKAIEEYEDSDGYRLFSNFTKLYIHSNEANSYKFYGRGGVFPRTYKIMVVTLNGEVKVSPAINQKAYWAEMTYDYSANTITEDYNGVYKRCIPWAFNFFLVTLFVEGLILLAFNLFRKKNILHFLIVNIITQIILNAVNIAWYLQKTQIYFLRG